MQTARVEIPRWRHAIINFPHPLLKKGLVILDTPGLNAIGTEPELTLNLLPNAHAIVFILAADTGVTKSDIEVWRNHIATLQGRKRAAWWCSTRLTACGTSSRAPPRSSGKSAARSAVAPTCWGWMRAQIYPISAQKGLLAKVNGDAALLAQKPLA